MKNSILVRTAFCFGVLFFGAATVAVAEPLTMSGEAKKVSVVTGSFITGAVVGGPFGAMAGMLVGAWLGDQVEEADRVDDIEKQLTDANLEVNQLTQQLAKAERASQQFAQIALEQLQLALLFKTDDSELTVSGQKRIKHLATFLVSNPKLSIRLDGYADPRGNAEYNFALSGDRVQSVVTILMANGVDQQRISTYAYGDSQSAAIPGDYDSYALERVVRIQLSKDNEQRTYAQVMISQ